MRDALVSSRSLTEELGCNKTAFRRSRYRKAKAEKFSFSSNFIVTFSSEPTFVPSIDFRSLGLGK